MLTSNRKHSNQHLCMFTETSIMVNLALKEICAENPQLEFAGFTGKGQNAGDKDRI